MKILHELNQLDCGGAERVVAGIIRHDKQNEHSVYTYKDGPMREVLEKAGAKVLIEGEGKQDHQCDLLHIHTGGAESHMANMVKGYLPTIETIHSPVVSAVRDSYIVARVGVSNQVTKINRNCRTIYNGIDVDRLKHTSYHDMAAVTRGKKTLGIPEDTFVIGRLGRIGQDKCLEEFLVACHKFQKDNDCAVLIVGGEAKDSPGYLAKVKIMAASLPVKNVCFVDEVEDVRDYYSLMDVFLYPSPTEGFGLVYFEAMACGVPVVTWDNELTRELLLGDALLEDNTINGLVRGLLWVQVYGRSSIAEIVEHAKQRSISEFSEQRMSENYQGLYQEIFDNQVK